MPSRRPDDPQGSLFDLSPENRVDKKPAVDARKPAPAPAPAPVPEVAAPPSLPKQTPLFSTIARPQATPVVAARTARAAAPAPHPAEPLVPQARPDEPRVYAVHELVRAAGRLLEARFGLVWVEGEISNLSAPRSGHVYFTLVDAEGQLPAVMFRVQAQRLAFRLADGVKVRARGRLSIYEGQGKFQLLVEALEPGGLGAREMAFLALKQKLQAEGLFDAQRKRPLPRWPRVVGIATSPTGAAIRDILRVAHRRGRMRFLVASCQVQGEAAPFEIIRAIRALDRMPEVDVILVGRGGGSAEDLAAFNDEGVARAIAACRVPVVSAVGHEVDFTIADFVADARAPTPSAAAELIVPNWADLQHRLDEGRARVMRAGRRAIAEARQRLDAGEERAGQALRTIVARRRRALDELTARLLGQHPRARVARDRAALAQLTHRLEVKGPARLADARRALDAVAERLGRRAEAQVADGRRALALLAGRLDALSPLGVLTRGYSLTRTIDGHVVTRASEVAPGDRLTITLREGALEATVDAVKSGDDG